jgi:uroporphyrinogen decarboxylase
VRTIRKELDGRVPLIGFSGSPWTLACYMVEGAGTKEFGKVKGMMFDEPILMHKLLDKLADSVILYLNGQIAAGAQAVQIFDTWGGVLTPGDYEEFSLYYMQKIVDGLTRENEGRKVPVILFSKGAAQWLDRMAKTGADALGVDWTIDLADARKLTGDKVALQGNMDPCILYSNPGRIREEVGNVLASYGKGNGHIFNLGHGIHPTIDPENVGAFINAVHELSGQYHS